MIETLEEFVEVRDRLAELERAISNVSRRRGSSRSIAILKSTSAKTKLRHSELIKQYDIDEVLYKEEYFVLLDRMDDVVITRTYKPKDVEGHKFGYYKTLMTALNAAYPIFKAKGILRGTLRDWQRDVVVPGRLRSKRYRARKTPSV